MAAAGAVGVMGAESGSAAEVADSAVVVDGKVLQTDGARLLLPGASIDVTSSTRVVWPPLALSRKISPGDYIFAVGALSSTGQLVAGSVWMSATYVEGTLSEVITDRVVIATDGGTTIGALTTDSVVQPRSRIPERPSAVPVRPGTGIALLGTPVDIGLDRLDVAAIYPLGSTS